MAKYEMSTWKLAISGEYETEEQAIKDLANKYMQCSKINPPCDNIPTLLSKGDTSLINWKELAKHVYLYKWEEVHGIVQKIMVKVLIIYPYNKCHWWQDTEKGKEFVKTLPRRRFKYVDITEKYIKEQK